MAAVDTIFSHVVSRRGIQHVAGWVLVESDLRCWLLACLKSETRNLIIRKGDSERGSLNSRGISIVRSGKGAKGGVVQLKHYGGKLFLAANLVVPQPWLEAHAGERRNISWNECGFYLTSENPYTILIVSACAFIENSPVSARLAN